MDHLLVELWVLEEASWGQELQLLPCICLESPVKVSDSVGNFVGTEFKRCFYEYFLNLPSVTFTVAPSMYLCSSCFKR